MGVRRAQGERAPCSVCGPQEATDKVGLSDPLETRSRNGLVTETTQRFLRRRNGAWYWWALPSPSGERVPHSRPLPWGHRRRGEARPPHGSVLCRPGFLSSLPLPLKKLHILVLCPLHLIFPSHNDECCDSHTHTPTRGSGRDNVDTRRPSPLEQSCPSPLSPVSLAWEEGT